MAQVHYTFYLTEYNKFKECITSSQIQPQLLYMTKLTKMLKSILEVSKTCASIVLMFMSFAVISDYVLAALIPYQFLLKSFLVYVRTFPYFRNSLVTLPPMIYSIFTYVSEELYPCAVLSPNTAVPTSLEASTHGFLSTGQQLFLIFTKEEISLSLIFLQIGYDSDRSITSEKDYFPIVTSGPGISFHLINTDNGSFYCIKQTPSLCFDIYSMEGTQARREKKK